MTKLTGDVLRDSATFGITAHIDDGKTSITELMLKIAGKKRSVGVVHQGNTTTDSMEQEQERGITIQSAPVYFEWNGKRVNLIDTPGHVDFGIEVARALRVLDGVVVVVSSCDGVQPQTITNWNHADTFKLPRIIFVNKMDKVGADFEFVLKDIEAQFKIEPLVVQIPVGAETSYSGGIDLFTMKYLNFSAPGLADCEFAVQEIPAELLEQARAYRAKMVARIAEGDEALSDKWLTDESSLTIDELKDQLRKDVLSHRLVPILSGSALKHKGCQPLLDAVVDYLPSPADVPPAKGEWKEEEVVREAKIDAPMCALAFKPIKVEHGTLTFIRVYSGKVTSGTRIFNSTRNTYERVQKLVKLMGSVELAVEELLPGEIGAISGMKETRTGDTLCDDKHPIILPEIKFARPVVFQAIEPKSKGDQDKMMATLVQMAVEDPSFNVSTNEETGQVIIAGQGELHLEIKVDILSRKPYLLATTVMPPEVAYREAIKRAAEGTGVLKKQTGGKGQYGKAVLRIEPLPAGSGFVWVNEVTGGDIPIEFIPAVRYGVEETLKTGILAGYPIEDIKVTLLSGDYHEVDSNEHAFKAAGSMALKDAFAKADPTLLEPYGKMALVVPEEFIGAINGEINSRRGSIEEQDMVRGKTVIKARMPMAESFGMTNSMRSKTQGKVTPLLEFSHYAEVPKSVKDKILADQAGEKDKK